MLFPYDLDTRHFRNRQGRLAKMMLLLFLVFMKVGKYKSVAFALPELLSVHCSYTRYSS